MFDKNAYRNNVLKPLHKNPVRKSAVEEALRQVQAAQGAPAVIEALSVADAAALFAITPGLPDAQIGDHVSDLRIFLNGAQRLYPVAKTLALLLEAIKAKVPGAYVTADFWKEVGEKTADAAKQRLSSFAAAVKQNGPLDVISPDELRQAAVAAGLAAFTDQDLAKAVGAKGVRVCEDFDPPQVNLGAPPLRQALSPSFRSLVDAMVLHERGVSPGEIRVIGEFSAVLGPARRRPVTMADLKKSQQTVDANNKYAGGGGQLTLTAIRQQCSTDEDLRKLALGWFLDRAAQLRGQGLLLLVALEKLKSSGLADLDARRIMAKATSGAPAGPDFGGVADLIAAGDLRGARLLLTTLTGADPADQTPEFKQAAAQVAAAEQKKDQALEAYRRALDAHDYPVAALRLAEAQAIDVEDEEIRRLEAQIPPAAPTGLQAAFLPAKGVVALSWRGARGPDVTYTVLRTQSGVPANPKAGTPVASPAADQRAVDPKPPVARAVAYAVFACRASGAYSAPASVQIVALPPPMDVKTAVTSTDVTVSWRVLPEATGVAVELIGPDGSKQSFAAPKGNRLTVKARELGRKHVILLRANYLVGGRLATSPEVSVEVIPRGAVQPVRDLAVASAALASGKPGLRAEWTAVTGYPTDLWLAPINQQINPGGRVSRADLDAMTATPVTGSAQAGAGREALAFHPPGDVRVLLPVTWDGESGLAGNSVVVGSAPPPSQLEAVRYGSELAVSWHWPDGDYQMEAAWSGAGARSGRRRLDQAGYRRDGGLRIADADQVTRVSVATVARGGGVEHVGDAVTIVVDAARPVFSYTLRLPRGLFGGREAQVEVTSGGFRGTAEFVAVIAPGRLMPERPDEGQEIARLRLSFAAGRTRQAAFSLPKVPRPYWVRLFPVAGDRIALEDPPTWTMKG